MTADTVVVGVNAAHDASACVLVNGCLVTAVAEERLTRVKYYEGFPHKAIRYCLDAVGLDINQIDLLVINQYAKSDYDTDLRNAGYCRELIVNPSHHLLHAYYAWVASGFRDAAILVLDGSGYSFGEYCRRGSLSPQEAPEYADMEEAESLYATTNGQLNTLSKRWAVWEASDPYYRFASLGHMYSIASQYIFGHWKHAGKTMGLAAFGDASVYPDRIVDTTGDEMRIDTHWITRLPSRSGLAPEDDQVCRNVAAKVQVELERGILHIVDRLYEATGCTNLALSGGVGLNSVANGRILRESKFTNFFITPAAGDAGVAIGAALYGHQKKAGATPTWAYKHDYHGREYDDIEIETALQSQGSLVHWEQTEGEVCERAAADIADGLVVGWFEGGSEFGPRSLGHRSILCDPRRPEMRDHLNHHVKFREPFRPYAASVLAEHAREYFDLSVDDPFMLIVAPVLPNRRDDIPSVTHYDGTCRIQSVRPHSPGRFRSLIEAFQRRTGLPLVLNTSFNIRGEPIVETPVDAIECFLASNFDVLYVGGRRIVKIRLDEEPAPGRLVPVLSPGLRLHYEVTTDKGAARTGEHLVQTRTGHRASITAHDFALLSQVNGRRTIDEIASAGSLADLDGVAVARSLQRRGLLAFRRADK